ncbi:MAG: PQQ-binding-like beta-propeller repeat protein [Marmoricola sp.]
MRRLLCLLVVPLLALSACGGADSTGPRAGGGTLANWPTYHRTSDRSGHVATGPTGRLQQAWTKGLSGQVYGEPLVIGSTLVVATEKNYVYGLDARTGHQRWRATLGEPAPLSELPCGNIDPLGVTGTPAYDARTGSVFVSAETRGGHHALWAVSPKDGTKLWHRGLDTQANRRSSAEQERGALLVSGSRVFTAFGGLDGDCDNYGGYVTSAPTSGKSAIHSYAVPTARKAGMWASPGPVLGANGHVYVASGNGAELKGRWDKSDSVTELSSVLLRRLSVFAPASWRDDNTRDLDLGSMSPAMVPAAKRIVIAGKRGTAYLLKPGFGGVGSDVARVGGCHAFGGAAVSGHTVLMPCKGEDAIRALKVGTSSLHWSWSAKGVYSSPVIAGNKVYVADQGSGDLVVLRLSDGKVVERHHAGSLPHFSSQVVSGDWVFVPTLSGVTAFRGS